MVQFYLLYFFDGLIGSLHDSKVTFFVHQRLTTLETFDEFIGRIRTLPFDSRNVIKLAGIILEVALEGLAGLSSVDATGMTCALVNRLRLRVGIVIIVLLVEGATAHSLHGPAIGSLTRWPLEIHILLLQINPLYFLDAHLLVVVVVIPRCEVLAPLELSVLDVLVRCLVGIHNALLLVDCFFDPTCCAHSRQVSIHRNICVHLRVRLVTGRAVHSAQLALGFVRRSTIKVITRPLVV